MFERVFLTGATSGIGWALAHDLADRGASLFLTGRDEGRLEELKELLSPHCSVQTFAADLAKDEDRARLIPLMEEFAPDLLINNAGFGLYGPALDFSREQQMDILRVNGLALVDLTLAAADQMKKRGKGGVIMNVSSVASFIPMPGMTLYAAAKAFATRFSESLDYELRSEGIRVLASCPGKVKTNFSSRAREGKGSPSKDGAVMPVELAVSEIWKQIEKGRAIWTFDWRYRLIGFFARHLLPKRLMMKLVFRSVQERRK